MQKLDMVNSNFYDNQVIFMSIIFIYSLVLSLPVVKLLCNRVPDIAFAILFLVYFYISNGYPFI